MYPFTYVRGFFTDFLKLFVRMYYWAPPPPRRRTRCTGAATPRRDYTNAEASAAFGAAAPSGGR
jgi:hypothetical protein